MKNTLAAVPLVALFASGTIAQWLPSCSWNDCMSSWQGSSCTSESGWDCVCGNSTAVAQINTCVATSCTNTTDQEAVFGAIAQLCANNGVTVTNSQQATFSATSGGSLLPSITGGPGAGPGGRWQSGDWSSWISQCSSAIGSAPSGWSSGGPWGGSWHGGNGGGPGGPGGPGGFGGPWGTKASGINCDAWTTWTAGWGPFSSWTGTWSGCSSTTASPSPATVTTTWSTNGHITTATGTTFGIQAAAVATSGSGSANAAPAATGAARAVGVAGGAAAAVFGLMVAL